MHIKIYFGEKPVFLCTKITEEISKILLHPDAIFIDELSSAAIKSVLHELKKEQFHAGVILHNNFEDLQKMFFKNFDVLEAAGGVVQNNKKEILFIYRLQKWDLPKGKMEKNEQPDICAVREVEEETGATHLEVKKKIGETYHAYDAFGKHFLKITHWYFMHCSNTQNLVPQIAENITQVKWIATKDFKEPMANTYSTIKDILTAFFDAP